MASSASPTGGTFSGPGVSGNKFDPASAGVGTHNVTYTFTDANNCTNSVSRNIVVEDVDPPVIGTIIAPLDPQQVGTQINVIADFTDACDADDHDATWDWGDGSTVDSVGTVDQGNNTVTGSHSYDTPGVYTLTLTVKDDADNSDTGIFEFIVIYDPDAGFVTGGGWIDSPPGAYTANPNLTGKAKFGFVSKYKTGASVPTGQTQFQFKAGDLNFHSSSYEWLVIAGAKAMYKGDGTVNGAAGFTFQINAIDGQVNGGGGVDKFRIKIKQTGGGVIYDNQMGAGDNDDPTTALGGGSIKVHKAAVSKTTASGSEEDLSSGQIPESYGLEQNYPNPFNPSTTITFAVPEASEVTLAIYNLRGQLVRTLVSDQLSAGNHRVTWNGMDIQGNQVSSGVYLYQLRTAAFSQVKKMSLMR